MIEDGLFDLFPCDAVLEPHNMPKMKTGEFCFRHGSVMASSDTLHLHVEGVGGYGALPEFSIDAAVLYRFGFADGGVAQRQPARFCRDYVGCIQSGEVPNVINGHALLKLSVRVLIPEKCAHC